jgi:ABC-type glycerol-3-phosphate transport system substrate-binding protein
VAVPQRQIWLALATMLVLLALAGCGSGSAATPTVAPAAAPQARTVLLLWNAWPAAESRALAMIVERFNRATPDVQVVLQSRPVARLQADLVDAVAEGGGPHMALVPSHTLGALAEAGALLPVADLLSASELGRLLPTAVGGAQVSAAGGAVLYGVPISFDTLVLYYNKANFAGAPPGDTAGLLAVARGLTDTRSEPPVWGLAYNLSLDRTIAYMYAFGGAVFDEQGRVALGVEGRAGAEAWLSWLVALREDPRILASTDGVAVDNALNTQQALMTIDWAHAAGDYNAIWPETMGVAPLPRLTDGDGPPRPYVQSEALVLNARLGAGAERAAAAAFARYVLGEDAQRELLRAGRQPVLMSLDLGKDDAALAPALREAAAAFRAQAATGQPMPNSRAANEIVWGVLSDMHSSALRRLLTPAQAVEGADATLRARLEAPTGP